ncbi:hypothetical protein GGTG_09150 [Gaeumannomyces tritici R3-111a-1]|uniref:Heterokaryon incompatibility domain-containing protein n=1 Tax=Gaeumannomyces tritici (strain R3-111a-1) TaxID=644352 RepID=J3P6K9_GAET3|nr:hypothetical protein GGTG_09150 [Gaeumannomyces tritici R3-111a-1]EJT72284.1 hypothetical protein GGTG_09150 [Gaeumannomyces tritici R3-111a-1]
MQPFECWSRLAQYGRSMSNGRTSGLHHRTGDSPVECTYQIVSLDDAAVDYETASYVWGSPAKTANVLIIGSPVQPGESAYKASRRLRSPERHHTIWLDALCINQCDDVEKTKQARSPVPAVLKSFRYNTRPQLFKQRDWHDHQHAGAYSSSCACTYSDAHRGVGGPAARRDAESCTCSALIAWRLKPPPHAQRLGSARTPHKHPAKQQVSHASISLELLSQCTPCLRTLFLKNNRIPCYLLQIVKFGFAAINRKPATPIKLYKGLRLRIVRSNKRIKINAFLPPLNRLQYVKRMGKQINGYFRDKEAFLPLLYYNNSNPLNTRATFRIPPFARTAARARLTFSFVYRFFGIWALNCKKNTPTQIVRSNFHPQIQTVKFQIGSLASRATASHLITPAYGEPRRFHASPPPSLSGTAQARPTRQDCVRSQKARCPEEPPRAFNRHPPAFQQKKK